MRGGDGEPYGQLAPNCRQASSLLPRLYCYWAGISFWAVEKRWEEKRKTSDRA